MKLRVYKKKRKACRCIKAAIAIAIIFLIIKFFGTVDLIEQTPISLFTGIMQLIRDVLHIIESCLVYFAIDCIEHWTSIESNKK